MSISYELLKYHIHYFNNLNTDFKEKEILFDQDIEKNNNNLNKSTINQYPKNVPDINIALGADREPSITKEKYSLVIGIAMYAENYELIDETLNGISKNLEDLESAGFPSEKILILIISDGIDKIDKEVYNEFTRGEISNKEKKIDEEMQKIFLTPEYQKNKKSQNYLISCYLNRNVVNKYGNKENLKKNMEVLFCIKKFNKGKLDSHFWLFMGFCKTIQPKYVILLDTGTIPEEGRTLANLILPMESNSQIAGTCGEIELSNPEKCTNFILSAQILEYKYAHVVDKHFENLFGFVSVLPGAFSAYRWTCLHDYESSLKEYFKTIDEGNANCEIANRYLAEDRIFCFSLFSIRDKDYTLKYISDSVAKTDAPEIYGEFLLQRRRWINGSNFALYHNLGIYPKIFKTSHKIRQIFIFILFLYYFIQVILGYFLLGTFYFAYYMICMKISDNTVQTVNGVINKQKYYTSLIMAIYLFIVIFCIITSLIIKPKREQMQNGKIVFTRTLIFKILSFLLGLYNIFAFFLAIYAVFKMGVTEDPVVTSTKNVSEQLIESYKDYGGAIFLICSGFATFFLPIIYEPSMISCWIKHFVQYLFLQPTYSIILSIFSICNIDDVSWGNRDSTHHVGDDVFKLYKIRFLFIWLVLNFLQGWGFSYIVIETSYDKILINTYSYVIAILTTFKLVCAMIGKFKYILVDKNCKNLLKMKDEKKNNNEDKKNFENQFCKIPLNPQEEKKNINAEELRMFVSEERKEDNCVMDEEKNEDNISKYGDKKRINKSSLL